MPGYGYMYLSDANISRELRCAAILNNPHIMVDRKTRLACRETPAPAPVPARLPMITTINTDSEVDSMHMSRLFSVLLSAVLKIPDC